MSSAVDFEKTSRPEISGSRSEMLAQLREICLLPEELSAEMSVRIQESADKSAAVIFDPEQVAVVNEAGKLIEWFALNRVGEEMPEGLCMIEGRSSLDPAGNKREPRVILDCRKENFPHHGHLLSPLYERMLESGLSEVLEEMTAFRKSREEEITAALRNLVTASNTYNFFNAFDVQRPQNKHLPLDRHWRQIREQQIKQDVIGRFALAPNALIMPGTQAHQELRRGLYALDDETRPQREKPKSADEALRKAKSYVYSIYEKEFNEAHEVPLRKIVFDPRPCELRSINIDGEDNETHESIGKTLKVLLETIGVQDDTVRILEVELLEEIINSLLDPRTSGELGEVIDIACEAVINKWTKNFFEMDLPSFITNDHRSQSAWSIVHAPQYETIDSKEYESEVSKVDEWRDYFEWRSTFRLYSDAIPASELEELKFISVGYVDKYGPSDCVVGARLVDLRYSSNLEFPALTGDEDLILNSQNWDIYAPIVPGFKQVSYDPREVSFGFIADPEGDPYKICEVGIDRNKLLALASDYEEIGLISLAEAITSAEALNVSQLVELIKLNSVYYLPAEGTSVETLGNSPKFFPNSIEDFALKVDQGKYFTQCTGAAAFLGLSLEKLFGNGCVGNTSGWVIQPSRDPEAPTRINAVRHAQLVFVHEGFRYILDATPQESEGITPMNSGWNTAHRSPLRAYNHYPAHTLPSEYKDRKMINSFDKTPEQLANDLLTRLKNNLQVAFSVKSDEALYNFVTHNLKKHDPVAVALSVLLRFTAGKNSLRPIDLEEIMQKEKYLSNCAEADTSLRHKLGITHYTPKFLDGLYLSVRELSWALQRARNDDQNIVGPEQQ